MTLPTAGGLYITMMLSVAILAALSAAPPVRAAVVVGSNHPLPGSDYDVLRYADDDAIRFAGFFDEIGIPTTLLTVPDAETFTRYGARAESALRPTRAQLLESLAEIREKFEAAEGQQRELYFVFSGHGSVSASRAYLHLFDGPFTRTDLFDHVIRTIPAERIHVVIDSCHSYFLVNSRGERVAAATDTEDVDRYPHVGFLLSTSDRREVQEWDGYQAGVFSYQVLGALRGAADVDRDATITYPEVHGYVTAANLAVKNPKARIRPYVRRPADRNDNLVDLTVVPPNRKTTIDLSGHFFVVDDERGRVLDAHAPQDAKLAVLLPAERPLFVRSGADGYRVVTSTTGGTASLEKAPELSAVAMKGSAADEFRMNLFSEPLTAEFVRGIDAVTEQVYAAKVRTEAPIEWYQDPLTVSLLGTGAAAVVLGAISTGVYVDARNTADGSFTRRASESEDAFRARLADQEAAADRAPLWQGLMVGGFAAGGALLIGGLVRALTAEDPDESLTVAPTDDGAAVVFTGSF